MNNRLRTAKNSLSVPWVLSGSMAMKMYGNKYGIPTRTPGNVNVVVNRKNLANAYANLFGIVPRNFPRNTSRVKNKNHYNLSPFDLLKAGSELAPSINTYVELNGLPVVSLENLLKYKLRSSRNAPNPNQKLKINSNIKKLHELIKASKMKTPLKQKQRVKPFTMKTRRNHNNNFSTPPRTTVKRLEF